MSGKKEHKDIVFDEYRLKRLADFFYEAGMLKNIPRSGFPFLGSGGENVAEHSFRVTIIGFALARMAGIDPEKVCMLCLFHDLHEARTGDFNYVNHRYNTCHARAAIEDATQGTGLEKDILGFWDELEENKSLATMLAHDADQLDLICNLQKELKQGNEFAREWLDSALPRLKTEQGIALAETILRTDPNRWWYGQVDKSWWIDHGKKS